MNSQQATRALRKLLGPKLAYRYDDKAPTAEQREEAEAERSALAISLAAAREAAKARRAELLRDPEYVRLMAECEAAEKAHSRASSTTRHYRVTVGTMTSVAGLSMFHVVAEGDNWQTVVDKVRAAKGVK